MCLCTASHWMCYVYYAHFYCELQDTSHYPQSLAHIMCVNITRMLSFVVSNRVVYVICLPQLLWLWITTSRASIMSSIGTPESGRIIPEEWPHGSVLKACQFSSKEEAIDPQRPQADHSQKQRQYAGANGFWTILMSNLFTSVTIDRNSEWHKLCCGDTMYQHCNTDFDVARRPFWELWGNERGS